MNLKLRNFTLKQKLLLLQACSLAGMAALLACFFWLEQRVGQQVIFPNFETQILKGHENTLKTLVDTEAQILAERLKSASTAAEQKAIIESQTDPLRFLEDQSGYFFSYDLQGTRINVPTNKGQNGQNCMHLKDSDGFELVRGLVDAAKKGGGFVRYRFDKPGKGVQPKLSYVSLIPGTDYFVGSGVYIDDVESERAALAAKVSGQMKTYFIYLGTFSVAILALTVTLALLLSRSITSIITKTAGELLTSAQNVSTASTHLSQTSQLRAEGSSQQAASTEETSASLELLSTMTRRNTDEINGATVLARDARMAADNGVADMEAMSAAMEAIKASSDDVAVIIKTINEIAFQTNILALNAAVEAARAGEAGMGFAVVADEVRNLAQRSAKAAEETTARIEGAIHKTVSGVRITAKVAEALNGIVLKSRQMDEISTRVAAASKEQHDGISQINQAMGQSSKVTQSIAASAEESAASAEELSAQAETMRCSVMELMQLVNRDRQNLARFSQAPRATAPRGITSARGRSTEVLAGDFNTF